MYSCVYVYIILCIHLLYYYRWRSWMSIKMEKLTIQISACKYVMCFILYSTTLYLCTQIILVHASTYTHIRVCVLTTLTHHHTYMTTHITHVTHMSIPMCMCIIDTGRICKYRRRSKRCLGLGRLLLL